MSSENVRERKKKRRFTLVFVPDAESEQTRTYSVSKWKLILALSTAFFGIAVLVAVIMIFTPLRLLLPAANSGVEQRYEKQIMAIRDQVSDLYREMTTLRNYNLQLRKAMGEEISPKDSLIVSTTTKNLATQRKTVNEEESHGQAIKKMYVESGQQSHSSQDNQSTFAQQQQSDDKSIGQAFPLTLPVNGYVSRGFDATNYHYGIDLVSNVSSPVLSPADGQIVFAGWTYDDGLMIIMAHSLGYVTVYKHNEALTKNTGATVKRGEVIALLGNTGKTSSGPHLHFEIWKDGIPYDPANYLLITQ